MELIDAVSIVRKAMLVLPVDESASWMEPTINSLKDGSLSRTGTEALKLKIKDMFLFNRWPIKSYLDPSLLYVGFSEAGSIMNAIHDSDCSNLSNGRSLLQKILTQGYYLPTIHRDVVKYVQRCDKC